MKAQTIQIRFEKITQYELVDNEYDIGDYNAFEVKTATTMDCLFRVLVFRACPGQKKQ